MSQTPIQFAREVAVMLRRMEGEANVFQQAVATVHGEQGQRIFERGEATSGELIGGYSTDPAYYKKPGSARKARYYAGGYKQFRQEVGRQGGYVDLKLTRSLQLDFNTALTKVSPYRMEVRLKNKHNAKKARGAEEHFGKAIFAPTREERERVVDIMKRKLRP